MSSIIKFKYVIAAFFVAIILLISISVLFISNHFYEDLVISNTSKQINEQLVSSSNLLELKLDAVHGVAWAISHDTNINEMLFKTNLSEIQQIENSREMQNIIINYSNSVEFAKAINLFSNNYTIDRPFSNMFIDNHSSSYGVYNYSECEDYILSSYTYTYKKNIELFRQDIEDKNPELIFVSTLSNIKDQKAILGILTDKRYLFNHYNNSDNSFYGNTIIIDDENQIIYMPENLDCDLNFLKNTDFSSNKIVTENKDQIITFNQFDNLKWYSVNITTREELLSSSKSTKNLVFLICTALMLIAIIGSLILSSYVIKPLSSMMKRFKAVQKGDFSPSANSSNIIEINDLNSNYNLMVHRISELINEVKISHELQNEYAFQALQAQINPHLLSNTLDAVYWMSDNDKICRITQNLANFYRLSLNNGKEITSVLDEIKHVNAYINIMLIRFKEKFVYFEEYDDTIGLYDTPKLILQPIIENAIIHGFKYMKYGGVLKLKVNVNNNRLVIIIQDNGVGVDELIINELINKDIQSNSYGIRNIQERIHVKYGASYGLSYKNAPEGGTIATILLPLITRGQINV